MAARPAKRQKRPVVVLPSSSESESTSGTAATQLDNKSLDQFSINVSTEKLSFSLPSRTRSGKIRTRPPAAEQSLKSSRKPGRSKKSDPEPSKSRAIQSFFTASVDQRHRSTQGSEEFDLAELEDLIEDDAICEEELRTQRSQSVSNTAGNGRSKRQVITDIRSRSGEELGCRGSQRFIQGGKTSTQPTKAASPLSQCVEDDTRPWVDKYAPTTLDELAVHKKKIDDVRGWLQDVLDGQSRKRMLILKGASGTGKTTTVSLLSQALKANILEWHNPTTSELATGYVSVLGQFDDFINRGGRFASLDLLSGSKNQEVAFKNESLQPSLSSERKIILVEEFPNTFMSSSTPLQAFRAVIQQFLANDTSSGNYVPNSTASLSRQVIPLVLIISETLLGSASSGDNFTVHRLFGPEILNHPAVSQIEFNPVARTFLRKALDLALLKDARFSGRRKLPGPSLLERLGEVGDIRSALASLEFLCLQDEDGDDRGGDSAVGKTKKSALTRKEKESLQVVTQREASLGMFHAVGKVVYNKRDEVLESDTSLQPLAQPPSYLSQHVRKTRSQVAVDELMDQTGTDTQTFISALHENYILSCYGTSPGESLDAVNGCIDSLSDSDLLGTCYGGRSHTGAWSSALRGDALSGAGKDNLRQDEICFQTAVRGILFSLPFPVERRAPSLPTQTSLRRGGPASRKGDAHRIFYPAALKLWRQREEIEGVVNLWVKRFNEGLRMSSSLNSHSKAVSGTSDSLKDKVADEALLCSGSSRRSQMVLEKLPYMEKILRSRPLLGSVHLPEIEKVTMFHGIGVQSEEISDFEDHLRENKFVDEKQVKRGVSAVKQVQNGHRTHNDPVLEQEVGSPDLSLQMDKQAGKLVLSDDDIEDD